MPTPSDLTRGVGRASQSPTTQPATSKGVHADFPAFTPKYAQNIAGSGGRANYIETMARMFVQIPEGVSLEQFTSGMSEREKKLAQVISGTSILANEGVNGFISERAKDSDVNNRLVVPTGYIDFLLVQANHSLQEKVQIDEVLNDTYVARFFGQQAPTFRYSGVLLNTWQDDWAMDMLRIYSKMGRGSALAKSKSIVRMRYDSLIVTGAMLNLSWSLSANNERIVPFEFSLLVKEIQQLKTYVDHDQITRPESFFMAGVDTTSRLPDLGSVDPATAASMHVSSQASTPATISATVSAQADEESSLTTPLPTGEFPDDRGTVPDASTEDPNNSLTNTGAQEARDNAISDSEDTVRDTFSGFGGRGF